MKARFFEVDTSHLPATTPGSPISQTLVVPGLSAYSIDHADLQYNGVANPIDSVSLSQNGDSIVSLASQFEQTDRMRLAVYYYGIRDYSLLFPQVKAIDNNRAIRMGTFYEESEKCFDAGSWLSFMLMCGAIFEHLLFFKLGMPSDDKTLDKVAKAALSQGIVNATQYAIIDRTRRARNVIHCNKMAEAYITRAEAMDARVLIEKLMLRL